jgi:hypothetical protein
MPFLSESMPSRPMLSWLWTSYSFHHLSPRKASPQRRCLLGTARSWRDRPWRARVGVIVMMSNAEPRAFQTGELLPPSLVCQTISPSSLSYLFSAHTWPSTSHSHPNSPLGLYPSCIPSSLRTSPHGHYFSTNPPHSPSRTTPSVTRRYLATHWIYVGERWRPQLHLALIIQRASTAHPSHHYRPRGPDPTSLSLPLCSRARGTLLVRHYPIRTSIPEKMLSISTPPSISIVAVKKRLGASEWKSHAPIRQSRVPSLRVETLSPVFFLSPFLHPTNPALLVLTILLASCRPCRLRGPRLSLSLSFPL